MAYHRETYHREEDRDRNSGGGWKSWFGLGDDNKDKNDYHYQRTTTYRNDDRPDYNRGSYSTGNTGAGYGGGSYQTSTYVRDSDRDRGYTGNSDRYPGGTAGVYSSDRTGYTGGSYGDNRGGYGYQTSNEYNRGNDYTSRGYDRDNNNRESTYVRSYNNDRDTYRPTQDSYSSTRYTSDNRGTGGYGGSSFDSNRYDSGRTGYGLGGGYSGSYDTNRTSGYGNSDRTSGFGNDRTSGYGNTDRDRYGGSYSYTSRANY